MIGRRVSSVLLAVAIAAAIPHLAAAQGRKAAGETPTGDAGASRLAPQAARSKAPLPLEPGLGLTTLPLWNRAAPGPAGPPSAAPTLTVFAPVPQHANGAAVIVAPGGAYLHLAIASEGREVADWFASRGVTAFLLKYRYGPRNPFPTPLLDAQRAVRLVRYEAAEYRVDPHRIGFIGFSAGGHLAALAGTLFDAGNPNAPDPIDRVSSRPDFLILAYAWLNAMQPNAKGWITYCSVLKVIPAAECRSYEKAYTPALHVTAKTPPTFLYATTDDMTVPVQASVDFYEALVRAHVPAELHLFAHGRHGSALGSGDPALDLWPELLERWLRDQGLLAPKQAWRYR